MTHVEIAPHVLPS